MLLLLHLGWCEVWLAVCKDTVWFGCCSLSVVPCMITDYIIHFSMIFI